MLRKRPLGGGPDTLIIDIGMIHYRIDEIKAAMQKQTRMAVLMHPGFTPESVGNGIVMHPDAVQIRCLTSSELMTWLDTAKPKLSTHERELILTYSLGVPLLLERFLTHRPVTLERVLPQCAAYIQGVVDQCTFALDFGDMQLRDAISRYSYFSVPDDVFPLLSDAKSVRVGHTPIALLQSKLKPEAELPVPATLQLYDLYEEWLKTVRNEPFFEVLVEAMPDAEQFLEKLGYCEFPDPCIDQDLSKFVYADARKGATFYAQQNDGVLKVRMNKNSDSMDGWLRAHILELARSSGIEAQLERSEVWGREEVSVRVPSLSSPLYLHKHDHEHAAVMPVAYTVECALQNKGMSYTVRYNDAMFRYDPQTKTYGPIQRVEADYWKELYGKEWEAEEA